MQRLKIYGWHLNANRGQIRIFEAVVATVIIFIAFSASILLIYPSHLWLIYEKEYFDRLGYNILHNLAETGAIELILSENDVKPHLEIVMNRMMPLLTYYNLTIFSCVKGEDGSFELQLFSSVSNAPPEVFRRMPEVSSAMMVYTSRSGETYYLILVLAKGGEKS